MSGILQRIQSWLTSRGAKQSRANAASDDSQANPCCGPQVHVAYRGKSDDRLYMAYNRTWQEVRYFQPNGLRVFCAQCRRRVL
jgi:hypothetical protein